MANKFNESRFGRTVGLTQQQEQLVAKLEVEVSQATEIMEKSNSAERMEQIDAAALADIISEQCDIENICADDLADNFLDREGQRQGDELDKRERVLENNGLLRPVTKTIDKSGFGIRGGSLSGDTAFGPFGLYGSLFGKKITYISSNIIGLSYDDFAASNPLDDRSVFTFDPYRGRLGSYWSLGPKGLKIEFLRNREEVRRKSLVDYDSSPVRFLSDVEADYGNLIDFGLLEETYTVTFDKSKFRDARNVLSSNMINSFARGGMFSGSIREVRDRAEIEYPPTFVLDTDFIDIHYDFYVPYTEKQLQAVEKPVSSLTYAVMPDYNFYIKAYENLITTETLPETDLPSLYVLSAEKKFKNPSPNIRRIFNLDKKIKMATIASVTAKTEDLNLDSVGQYFDEFAISYPSTTALFREVNFQKLKNIIFPIDKIADLTSLNEKKRMFPMYVDVKFSTDKTSKFASILRDTRLTDKMTVKIADKVQKQEFKEATFVLEKRDNARDSEISNFSEFVETNSEEIRFIELADLLEEIQSEDANLLNLENAIVLSEQEDVEKTQTKGEKQFLDSLYFAIFKNKMSDLLEQTLRTHDDILKGRSSYNETVLYRIAKFRGTNTNTTPVQNVFVPNSPDTDVFDYVDTQVHYDQEYTYVVYAYQLIIGNKYRYVELEDGLTKESKKYTVENEPYIILAEVDFLTQQTRVYDSPPPPPEVNIVAYKGQNNKALIMLNSSANTYKAKPVIIEQSDEQIFEKISIKQDVAFGQQIEFSSDDPIAFYEIYRLEQRPTSYKSFSENLLTTLDTDVSKESIQQASSAALVDTVEPNKKFYYMFRAIDIHGKPSNPSEIYEMEIISENGTIFPIVKTIELKQKEDKTDKKGAKRFIQIIPSVLQTVLNENSKEYNLAQSAEKAIKETKLGLTDSPVWDKKFKIRLVSKQTKKVLDFDVKFDFLTEKRNKNSK